MQPTIFYKKYFLSIPNQIASTHTLGCLEHQTFTFVPSFTELSSLSDCKKPKNRSILKRFNPKFYLKIFGILSFVLPFSYFVAQNLSTAIFTPVDTAHARHDLDTITQNKTLTIATIADNGLYFGKDGYSYGFGVDVVRGYADHLGVNLNTLVLKNTDEVMNAVATGQADMALTNSQLGQSLSHVSLSCGQNFLAAQGLNQNMGLQIPTTSVNLAKSANDFLCDNNVMTTNQHLAAFYVEDVFKNDYSEQKFNKIIKNNLPIYQSTFQTNAKQHNLDWELLVAMGYQESQLNPEAISPTGVRGIMMLTNDTATAMGVTDRVNPAQSIEGGAKYFNSIQKMFDDVPSADRIWFSLASYNMGPQAIKNIQATLQSQGKNSNSWAEVYRYMMENKASNSRYVQCIHYVTNIRGFLEVLKQNSQNSDELLIAQATQKIA